MFEDILFLNNIIHFLSKCYINLNFELGFTYFKEIVSDNNKINFLNKYIFMKHKFIKKENFSQEITKNRLKILTTINSYIQYFIECNYIVENKSINNIMKQLIDKEHQNNNNYSYEHYLKIMFIFLIHQTFNINNILFSYCDNNIRLLYRLIKKNDFFNIKSFNDFYSLTFFNGDEDEEDEDDEDDDEDDDSNDDEEDDDNN